jgi:NAD(P)-dependent dehydrogenase (short-subunit alcohol dehydrogenase family)
MSDINLQNKTILITGASSGMGQSLARYISDSNAQVIITGRDEERLLHTYNTLNGSNNQSVKADLALENDMNALIKELPPLNGVVFNAGIVEYSPVKFLSADKIDAIFNINYKANVLLTQGLLKNKKLMRGASLVYISSISSKLGIAGTALYASSKAALNAFVKVVATEVAPQGIRANSICPGIVQTPMTLKASEASATTSMDDAEKQYPLGYGKPDDINGIVSFLLSDNARWVTGINMDVDGGYTLK